LVQYGPAISDDRSRTRRPAIAHPRPIDCLDAGLRIEASSKLGGAMELAEEEAIDHAARVW